MPRLTYSLALAAMGLLGLVAGCTEAPSDKSTARDDVVAVPADSPGMQQARRLGAESWPEGFRLYQAVPADKPKALLVKLGFPTSVGGLEYMWVQVAGKAENTYSGILANDPLAGPGWQRGDGVAFADEEVVDWVLHVEGEASRGGFTACQIAKAERTAGRAAAHLAAHPRDCDWASTYEIRAREGAAASKLPPV